MENGLNVELLVCFLEKLGNPKKYDHIRQSPVQSFCLDRDMPPVRCIIS